MGSEGFELAIRTLGAEHVDAVLGIETLSFSHPWSRDSYQYELGVNSLSRYYGCFAGDKLVGFAGLWLVLDEGHIANVAVLPDFRGQGLGKLLMARVIADCQAEGISWLTLEVRVSNARARRLYEHLGFSLAGRRKGYYTQPSEDALIMTLALDGYRFPASGMAGTAGEEE